MLRKTKEALSDDGHTTAAINRAIAELPGDHDFTDAAAAALVAGLCVADPWLYRVPPQASISSIAGPSSPATEAAVLVGDPLGTVT
jgi:hypothetical protein